MDSFGTTTDVHILDNGISLFDGTVNGFMVPTAPLSTTLSLGAGDRIDFVVGYGANHDFTSDTTGISAQIAPVPEPSTAALLGLGGATMMLCPRRKRSA